MEKARAQRVHAEIANHNLCKGKGGHRVLVWGPQAVPLHQGRISLTISRRWSISCFVVIYDRRLRASSRNERRATNREFRVTVLSSPLQGL